MTAVARLIKRRGYGKGGVPLNSELELGAPPRVPLGSHFVRLQIVSMTLCRPGR